MMKPRGGYVFYTHIYNDFTMMICHENMVMLHSTTGPYGRLVIEVAYGEMIFSLHQSCMGDDSSGRVVGGVGMLHHPCSTYPDQHQCRLNVLFFGFQYIKSMYMYIVLKIYI